MNRSFVQWMNYIEVIIEHRAILGLLVLIYVLIERVRLGFVSLVHIILAVCNSGLRRASCTVGSVLVDLSEARGATFCEFNFCELLSRLFILDYRCLRKFVVNRERGAHSDQSAAGFGNLV